MSDLKMSSYEVIGHPERKLCDFLPKDLAIINRSGLPDPLTLEIVKCSNWMQVVDVHGDTRDAKLVLKALTSYDSNQELIVKQQEQIELLELSIKEAVAMIGEISYLQEESIILTLSARASKAATAKG